MQATIRESINDFIEHFDTKLYWIINEHHQKPKNFSSKGNTLKKFCQVKLKFYVTEYQLVVLNKLA